MRYYIGFILAVAIFMTGCTHKVVGPSATAVKVRSSYANKIAGNWVIIIDEGSTVFSRDIQVSSQECSFHNAVFSSEDSIQVSLASAVKNIFEDATLRKTNPTVDDMKVDGLAGYALISLDHFLPRIECHSGFWSIKCKAESEIVLGIDIRGHSGEKLLGTTAGGRGYTEGGSCGDIGKLSGEAYRRALSNSLEEMIEKVSNSKRLRKE